MIRDYYLFSDLNEKEVDIVKERIFLKKIAKDTLIFEEGDSIDAIFFIDKGDVEIYKNVKEDKKQNVLNLHRGDFFGEVGVLENKDSKRFASAIAVTDVEVLVLLKSDFNRIIKENKEIEYKIYKSFLYEMIGRLRLADNRIREFFKETLKDS